MIKACLIILSCVQWSVGSSEQTVTACAVDSNKIVSINYWGENRYRLRVDKEVLHVKETPSQVAEKVRDCK